MKKLIVMLMLTLFSIGAYAQTQQGQSSFGFNLGYNFNDVGNATIGIDYRYCVTDAFRLTPSITHLVKNDGLSAWAIDMNAHYVFKLSEMFGFYPLAGLSLSFWKAGPWDATRFGANIGNEDEEEEDTENPENPSDEPSGETINQAVEGEKEDNPLSAVETITVESKV